MTVIGIIGIIGTVEYSHAEGYEITDEHVIIDFEYYINNPCNNTVDTPVEIFDIQHTTELKITNVPNMKTDDLTQPLLWHSASHYFNTKLQQYTFPMEVKIHHGSNNIQLLQWYVEPYTDDHVNEILCYLTIYKSDKLLDQYTINLIARTFDLTPTNQPTTTNNNDIWKERYNTCYDKKENLKTVRDTYKSELNILQSNNTELNSQLSIYKQNLTNANFEIDKLKQEKADLIKKVETLETQLSEN